jgi:predicted protein tyrosine phosphatase
LRQSPVREQWLPRAHITTVRSLMPDEIASKILVSPLSRVMELVARRKPDRVISVLDPETPFPELGPSYTGRHLRLVFHDAHDPGPGTIVPAEEHITEMLAFLGEWADAESLLVHCHAGIGRSTATAFVAACYRNPAIPEQSIALELRRVAPLSRPNELLVRVADRLMEREGRMSAAIAETGRGLGWVDVAEGVPFELPSRFA